MPPDRSKKLAIQKRRHAVADLYLKGWSQTAIAEQLGICQTTVCVDLKKIRQQWRESAVRDFDEARQVELLKLDRIEREAWAGWERSQKPTQAAVISSEIGRERTRKSSKNQVGDPKFLEQVLRCILNRRAMLGLDAPTRIAPVMSEPVRMTPEQRQQHIDAIIEERKRMLVRTPDHNNGQALLVKPSAHSSENSP
ncbi:MAG TPA: helix-turn-helix domain-containing protein [Pirellulales bacterium]|jgi:predicted transcriptional regulator